MKTLFVKNILTTIISIFCLLTSHGCAIVLPEKQKKNEFPVHNVSDVSHLTAIAKKAWCKEGKYNGKHISKVRIGGHYDSPLLPNPEGPGRITKQYISYVIENKIGTVTRNDYYGVTFTLYATEDGIIYRCDYIDKYIY